MLGNYAFTAASTLWIVDYIETLPAELRSIWKKKTGTSVLFLVNRYTFLLFIVLGALLNFPGNGTDMQLEIEISTHLFKALFALRVYAIYNKNIMILEIALIFIILRFVLDIWSAVIELGVQEHPMMQLHLIRLGYNILIFVLTAIKTAQHAVEMKRMGQSSITQVIIRDVAIMETICGVNFLEFVPPFYNLLPNLLISRLMLNLHTYSAASQGQQTNVSSMKFAFSAPPNDESFNEGEDEAIEMDNLRREYERPVEA
ncbi:MAG: hypothetical protein NXY57DRAFT_1036974 [Lentinula lateritia]|nr:MAG: hypothetical protein NXY57DRAFT_1036974 [Lentinula lateritia]